MQTFNICGRWFAVAVLLIAVIAYLSLVVLPVIKEAQEVVPILEERKEVLENFASFSGSYLDQGR